MDPATIARKLAALGLGHLVAGPVRRLAAPPEEPVARGDVATAVPTLQDIFDRLERGEESLVPRDDPEVPAGFRLAALAGRPSIFKVNAPSGPVRLRTETGSGVLAIEGGGALVDVARAGLTAALAADRDEGFFIVAGAGGDGLDVAPIARPIVLPEDAEVSSPAREWADAAAAAGDAWIAALVRELLAEGGPLAEAAAAGALARLREREETRDERRAALEALLAGRPDPEADRERAWARALPDGARATVERHALASAALLSERLDDLSGTPDPDDPGFAAAFRAVLHDRDDLEGVRILLRAAGAGAGETLERALEALDERGAVFIRAVPRPGGLADDERLWRAARTSPEGWWVRPVRWS